MIAETIILHHSHRHCLQATKHDSHWNYLQATRHDSHHHCLQTIRHDSHHHCLQTMRYDSIHHCLQFTRCGNNHQCLTVISRDSRRHCLQMIKHYSCYHCSQTIRHDITVTSTNAISFEFGFLPHYFSEFSTKRFLRTFSISLNPNFRHPKYYHPSFLNDFLFPKGLVLLWYQQPCLDAEH